MSDNRYRIVVEIPKSNGFSTTSDLHLAEIVKREVERALRSPASVEGCIVRVEAR